MRVFVGMSGGVDSSLSAALLKEQGHEVVGVYMKNWTEDLPGMRCPWAEDLADAKRVAVQLGIDFRVYDFENQYKEKVVNHMIGEYQAGRTPNPDIMCNQEVKFKLFLETALQCGAERIATGHYARTSHGKLLLAKDSLKDQTYFLYRTTKAALQKTLFPLGDYLKSEVRAMAKKRGLYTADKRDSQGICFIGQIGVKEFLSQYVSAEPGEIIDQRSGLVLGTHDGAIFYTMGQRHGLGVGGGLPYYVTRKDMSSNTVFVSTDLNDSNIWRNNIEIDSCHFIDGEVIQGEFKVRVRHRAPLIKAKLSRNKIELSEPQRAITSGQSVVIYDKDTCLGGGVVV